MGIVFLHIAFNSFGKIPRNTIAGSHGKTVFNFDKKKKNLAKLSSKVAVLFCTPTSNEWQLSVAPYHCQHLMLSVFADFSQVDSCIVIFHYFNLQFLGGSGNHQGLGSIPGLGRSPGRGHDNPLQYPCLENPHGQRSLVGYSPWGWKELDTTEWLSAGSEG